MTFTIDTENNISAFATQGEAAANLFESFTGQKELTQPYGRLAGRPSGLVGCNRRALMTFESGNRVVRMRGLEPPSRFWHMNLNHARLPIPPQNIRMAGKMISVKQNNSRVLLSRLS